MALRFFHLISFAVLRTRLVGGDPCLHSPWRVPETGLTSPQVGYARHFAAFFLRFFAAFFAFLAPFFLAALRFFAMNITSFLIANGSRPKKSVKKNLANCLQFCIGRFPPISSVFAPNGTVGAAVRPANPHHATLLFGPFEGANTWRCVHRSRARRPRREGRPRQRRRVCDILSLHQESVSAWHYTFRGNAHFPGEFLTFRRVRVRECGVPCRGRNADCHPAPRRVKRQWPPPLGALDERRAVSCAPDRTESTRRPSTACAPAASGPANSWRRWSFPADRRGEKIPGIFLGAGRKRAGIRHDDVPRPRAAIRAAPAGIAGHVIRRA